jgi:hypothetical protein
MNKKIIIILLILLILFSYYSLKEGYDNYSHSDMPINTMYSCQNICSTQNICSITREQCISDIDCYCCSTKQNTNKLYNNNIIAYNDSGKSTNNMPESSVLLTDIGTKAYQIPNKKNSSPELHNKGKNTWRNIFDYEKSLYDKRYNSSQTNYNTIPSLSGEFTYTGPRPSNL